MADPSLPPDFSEFLRLLNAHGVDYLVVGGDRVIRLGVPPVRIEILTTIDGVEFDACYPRAQEATLGGVAVRIIGLDDLKTNKRAAGRHQDLADLEHLP